MKIKQNQILALNEGLNQGAECFACGLAARHSFCLKREQVAFDYGFSLGCTPAGLSQWKDQSNKLNRLEYFINSNQVQPIGWRIWRVRESNLQPFIEEI